MDNTTLRYWAGLVLALLSLVALPTVAVAQSGSSPWAEAIDEFWGEGAPADEQLATFDAFWTRADTLFAAFHSLPALDWDALRDRYRPEIEGGVSRGRLAGIMAHLALALREGHTIARDTLVAQTEAVPGVPLLYGWDVGETDRFGACLTPLPDRTLLVYAVAEGHPLGLAPGDIVLGYDGVRWEELYPELLAAELPLAARSTWGAAPSAYEHGWLGAAGMNWHLFSELDVVRHATGDTLRLPVGPLEGYAPGLFCSEQLSVPGVPFPDRAADEHVSWGVVEGTNVGYVYVWSWILGDPDKTFRKAIEALVLGQRVDGLVVDFRYNRGGWVANANDGFAILFDETVETLGMVWRSDPDDPTAFEDVPYPAVPGLDIPGDPATSFDGPIAVLTGPGAFSAGDFNALRLSYHPRARRFGKPTAGSFTPGIPTALGEGYVGRVAFLNAYRLDTPGEYLVHAETHVDEPVWLTPDDAAQGEDTVTRAALAWIQTAVGAEPLAGGAAAGVSLSPSYPNPFSTSTSLSLQLARGGETAVHVYDVLGRRVGVLVDEHLTRGVHALSLSSDGLASGVYVVVAQTGGVTARRKVTVAR